MADLLAQRPDAKQILALARKDKRGAAASLIGLPLDQQVELVCETPLVRRATMLELLEKPEDVIPLIPEAELVFTVKAVGVVDGSWILEYATTPQLVACADLDAWNGIAPDVDSLGSWLAVFAEAGDDTVLRAGQGIDTELWVLYLRDRIWVELKPNDDESWQPPEGGATLDGQFYYIARKDSDDLAAIGRLVHVLFQHDYWLYFRVMQGVNWEMDSDLEEWAMRWRTGRLEDLGFPTWDESMRIYGFIRPDQHGELPEESTALDIQAWDLPVWMPNLPATRDSQHAVFRAAAELDQGDRTSFFYSFIGLANKIAMADGLALGDIETLPKAIEKVAVLASLGLEFIAKDKQLDLVSVVKRASLERLFRVGANLDRPRAEQGRVSYSELLDRSIAKLEGPAYDPTDEPE